MKNLWLLFVVGLATGFISEKVLVSSQTSSSSGDDLYLEGRTSRGFPFDDDEDDEDGEDAGSGSGSGYFSIVNATEEEVVKFLNITDITLHQETILNEPEMLTNSPHPTPTPVGEYHHKTTKETRTMVTATTNVFSEEEKGDKVPMLGSTSDWFTETTSTSTTPSASTAASTVPSTSTTPISLTEITTTKLSTVVSVTKGVGNDVVTEGRVDDTTTENVGNGDVISKVKDDVLAEGGRSSRLDEKTTSEEVTSENLWERIDVLAAVIACGVIGFLCAIFLLALLAYRMKKKDEGSYDLGDTKLSATAYQKAPTQEFYA
ncbi:syndecan-2-like isoform X1 [Thalassophryne amazonica]|uniref:syndecan-2-like isoform X1 n=1 Tax=Thalassophryne amazonica TaxID=390379 RepID=UPI001470E47C|nr:syndecan-2-like isoform X1 [Thalassophryne amazonica]